MSPAWHWSAEEKSGSELSEICLVMSGTVLVSDVYFPPTAVLSTNPPRAALAAGFTEDNESHADISRGGRDPEEVFFLSAVE